MFKTLCESRLNSYLPRRSNTDADTRQLKWKFLEETTKGKGKPVHPLL